MNFIHQNSVQLRRLHLYPVRRRWLALLLAVGGWLAASTAFAAETWTALTNTAPGQVSLMRLLSDGTVLCQQSNSTNWFRLTPDANGSYVNGTWTTLAPMHDSRLYFSSQLLRDGRVFVAGAEYGSGTNTAEVYQPTNNTWTSTPAPGKVISDASTEVLPDGNVLVAPVEAGNSLDTLIYNVVSNSWSAGPTLLVSQNEASWVKLPDDSILTIDKASTTSERFIPALNQWIADCTVPVNLYNNSADLGPGFLLPNGKVFFLGGTNKTALYTPTGSTNSGTWIAGPDIPNNLDAADAPAAMMANGKILCAFGQNGPSSFYEYDSVSNAFFQVSSPTGGSNYVNSTFVLTMLDLPDGSVLLASFNNQLYAYTPDGAALTNGKPFIQSVTQNLDGSYHVTGTLFNGLSEGAAFGDDWQMNTDYPIARLTNSAGAVFYCRTFNWSSTSVMTGTNLLATEMTLPAGLPPDVYALSISANGISSDPFTLTILNLAPTNIVAVVSGTNLNISWPADQLGWRLLIQTNNLANGVSRNSNDWAAVAGSASTNQITVPILRGQPTEFYRLIFP